MSEFKPNYDNSVFEVKVSDDTAAFIHDRGMSLDARMPHAEACLAADEYSVDAAEMLRVDLKPVIEKESFAYILSSPSQPVDHLHLPERTSIARVKALATARALGVLGTSDYEEDGALLSLVTPAEGYEHTQSYRGKDDPLLFHQEMLPQPGQTTRESLTRFVILSAVSDTTPRTPTLVSSIRHAMMTLSEKDVYELKQPTFKLLPYDAMKLTDHVVEDEIPEPIIHPDGLVVADFADVESSNIEGAAAFKSFLLAANFVSLQVTPNPGDTLIVDNHESFHGRGAISEGVGKRLLIRAHVLREHSA